MADRNDDVLTSLGIAVDSESAAAAARIASDIEAGDRALAGSGLSPSVNRRKLRFISFGMLQQIVLILFVAAWTTAIWNYVRSRQDAQQASDEVRRTNEALDAHIGHFQELMEKREFVEALAVASEAHGINLRQGGPEDLPASSTFISIGQAYAALGRYEVARENFDAALAIRRNHLGEDDLGIADAYKSLGMVEVHLHNADKALEHLTRAEQIMLKHVPEVPRADVARLRSHIGIAMHMAKDREHAITHLRTALTQQEQLPNVPIDDICRTRTFLMMALAEGGDSVAKEEVVELAEAVLTTRRSQVPQDDGALVRALLNAATAYGETDDSEQAKVLLTEAMVVHLENPGLAKTRLASLLNNLAVAHMELGEHDHAQTYLEQAEEIYRSYLLLGTERSRRVHIDQLYALVTRNIMRADAKARIGEKIFAYDVYLESMPSP